MNSAEMPRPLPELVEGLRNTGPAEDKYFEVWREADEHPAPLPSF